MLSQGDAVGTFRLTSGQNTSLVYGSGPFFVPRAFEFSALTIPSRFSYIQNSKYLGRWNRFHLGVQQWHRLQMVLSFTLQIYFAHETVIGILFILLTKLTIAWADLQCLKSGYHLHMFAQDIPAIAALQ